MVIKRIYIFLSRLKAFEIFAKYEAHKCRWNQIRGNPSLNLGSKIETEDDQCLRNL